MENIEDKLNKLLNKIDKMDKEIKNIVVMRNEINKKIIELERKLNKNE